MYIIPQKLFKLGEFGHGKTTLCVISGFKFNHNPVISTFTDTNHKLFIYFLYLNKEESLIEEYLINTFNYLDFSNTIIVDYPVFIFLSKITKSLKLFQKDIPHILVFNPFIPEKKLISKIFKSKIINLEGQEIAFKQLYQDKYDIFENLPDIQARKFDIISLQDSKSAIKLATLFKNSRVYFPQTYMEAINALYEILKSNA